jgi:hypothetical protein
VAAESELDAAGWRRWRHCLLAWVRWPPGIGVGHRREAPRPGSVERGVRRSARVDGRVGARRAGWAVLARIPFAPALWRCVCSASARRHVRGSHRAPSREWGCGKRRQHRLFDIVP